MSAIAGFFRETLRAPRATSTPVHLADAFAVSHGHAADPAARDYTTKQGMVWEPGGEAWETKLATLRSFRRAHGNLALRQDAVWGERDSDLVPIGQLIANLRRKGGLGKDAERAEQRAAQLSAIDEDWCCPWAQLTTERQERLTAPGVKPTGRPAPVAKAPASIKSAAASRTCSRRARSSAGSPPPTGYLIPPA
ncbi:helicase associated domain-containing protein [Streptomyces sp. NBC_01718]|uniref:helicase associated domain-containing protein n=1 Tax=Streptomyces sp. NBC_01718 TaxID=2975919 RepID=UPI00352F0002